MATAAQRHRRADGGGDEQRGQPEGRAAAPVGAGAGRTSSTP